MYEYAISLKQSFFLIVGTRSLTDVLLLINLKLLQQFAEALLTIICHPLTRIFSANATSQPEWI